MDKFNQLLNESTIVDFKLLWRLALRYRSHLIVAVIAFATLSSYYYFQQPTIYAVSVPLKVISNHTVAQDLSSLLPTDNPNSLNLNELKISLERVQFLKSYAELIIQDPEFEKLNFSSITAKKSLYGLELKQVCRQDKVCLIDRLVDPLRNSFSVEQGLTENRFNLVVSALEKNSAQRLSRILLKAVELDRIHVRQYVVLKEIETVGNLIKESHSVLQKMDGYKALEEQEKLQNNIADLKERIRMIQYSSNVESANVATLESRLSENKKSTKNKGVEDRHEYEKIQKAQARLVEVKQNISILSNISEDKRSSSDKLIIGQLKEEQSRLLKILPSESHRKKMELTENFVEGQIVKTGDYEFDYKVAKSKLDRLNQDYETSKAELSELLQQKIINENKVIGMKTDLDFLKNLEAKLLSLKLLNATMTSDLFFENESVVANQFRQATYLKILFFSFSIIAFIYLISIVLRFLADDIIYGEEDVRSHLKNLDFIGEVPMFD